MNGLFPRIPRGPMVPVLLVLLCLIAGSPPGVGHAQTYDGRYEIVEFEGTFADAAPCADTLRGEAFTLQIAWRPEIFRMSFDGTRSWAISLPQPESQNFFFFRLNNTP